MQYTEHLRLKKPESTDFYDINDFNSNADVIDEKLRNLSNVDNTADFDKPISNPQKVYLDSVVNPIKEDLNSVAGVSNRAMNSVSTHLADKSNPHGVDKTDLGLDKVDNTSDMDKPVSTATQKALEELESKGNITDTATGENITVTNSADAPVRSFKVDGRTEQVTTTGMSLIDLSEYTSRNWDGIQLTNNGDGTYTLNGTATKDRYFDLHTDLKSVLEVGKTYKIIGCPKGGGFNSYILIDSMKSSFADAGNGSTFTYKNDGLDIYVAILIKNGVTVNNLVFKPMIVDAELYPNITYEDFEPYTGGVASPNPDYPQRIKGVCNTYDMEVTVNGKNLFDGVIENGGIYPQNGKPYSKNTTRSSNFIKVEPNEKYSVVRESTGASLYFWVIGYDENKNPITDASYSDTFKAGLYPMSGNTTQCDFITSPTTHYVKWADESSNDLTQKVIIKKYDGDYTYEPYKSQEILIPEVHQLYGGDYFTLKNGKLEIVRNNARVDLGTLNYTIDDASKGLFKSQFYDGISPRNNYTKANIKCTHYIPNYYYSGGNGVVSIDGTIGYNQDAIYIHDEKCTNYDVSTFKEYMYDKYMLYKLAEPTTEVIDVDVDLSTYCNVTHITNDCDANMEVEYFVNSANGEVVGELQEQVNKTVSYLNDFMVVETFSKDVTVPSDLIGEYIIEIGGKDGYIPIFCKVETHDMWANCQGSEIDVTSAIVSATIANRSSEDAECTLVATVIYVKNI